jgi:hypothetical protein
MKSLSANLFCARSAAFIIAIGCTEKPTAPPTKTVEKKPAPAKPVSDLNYVMASSLKLRKSPNPNAKVIGRLRINYPLKVLAEKDGFAQVQVRNGTQGWVGKEFLDKERLSKEQALKRAKSTHGKDRLTWLQRAAALAPTDVEVLQLLKGAYVDDENLRAASIVKILISNLKRTWYPIAVSYFQPAYLDLPKDQKAKKATSSEIWLEWEQSYVPGPLGPIPKPDWETHGVKETDRFWVLPSKGPAIEAKPIKIRRVVSNSCGETYGVEIMVDLKLAEGVLPLVATVGKPPASWLKPESSETGLSIKRGIEIAEKHAKENRGSAATYQLKVAKYKTGVRAVVAYQLDDSSMPMDANVLMDKLEIDEKGKIVKVDKVRSEDLYPRMPLGYRDITGDGQLDEVSTDQCAVYIQTAEGHKLVESEFRCCGC